MNRDACITKSMVPEYEHRGLQIQLSSCQGKYEAALNVIIYIEARMRKNVQAMHECMDDTQRQVLISLFLDDIDDAINQLGWQIARDIENRKNEFKKGTVNNG